MNDAPPPPSWPSLRAAAAARARASVACVALLAAGAGLLAGCGSSNPGGTSADPASAVPADAVLYAGAAVRPEGSLKAGALAAGRALTHQSDPYLRLLAALQTPGSRTLDFAREVAPWLGPHAGVFLTSLRSAGSLGSLLEQGLLGGSGAGAFPFANGGAQGAIVLDTSNTAKARAFLAAQAARAGAHATSYRGVPFQTTSAGVSFGLIHRFAVIGSESGLRGVIETTSAGASALARSDEYSKLASAAPPDALAHLYSAAPGQAPAASQEGLTGLLGALTGGHAANVSLVPSASSLTLDADSLSAAASTHPGGLLAPDPQAAQALDELPGESWLAIGLGHVGATLGEDAQEIQALASLGSSGPPAPTAGLSFGSLLDGLLAPLRALGAKTALARRDFASWMGSAGIFASGANLLELKAGVSISSTNPALSRAAVAELAEQLHREGATVSPVSIPGTEAALSVAVSGLPVKLDIADGRAANGQTKFVLGVAEASVSAALDPSTTMSNAASRSAAATSLGEGIQPSLIVNFSTFLSLLEGIDLLEQPPISQFVPYLRSSTTLAGGGHRLGGEAERFRLVLGLQGAGG
ncbi:MAG TPA: DUF3352 domain-containing protein [Solirubrobacteraceae bacterium]|nr:DUF3352 domain-containing protein [Solirubrobacteraceae bacterium]